MVCASQLSLYNMKMLEHITGAIETLRSDIALLAHGKAIEPAKPTNASNEEAQEGSGAAE